MPVLRPPEDSAAASITDRLDQLLTSSSHQTVQLDRIERALRPCLAPDPNRLYTRAETALLLAVSLRTVDRRIRFGPLVAQRSGRSIRVTGRSIANLFQTERRQAVEVLAL